MIRAMIRRARAILKAHPKARILVSFRTDGGWDDLKQAQIEIARLAAIPGIAAAWVAPVDPEGDTMSRIDAAFAPFGDRHVVNSRFDVEDGAARVRSLIRK
jgi:hypothetical protein